MTQSGRVIPRVTQFLFAGIGGALCAGIIIAAWSFPSAFGLLIVIYAIPVGFILGVITFGVGLVICSATPRLASSIQVALAAIGGAAASALVVALGTYWIELIPTLSYSIVVFVGTFVVALGAGLVFTLIRAKTASYQ